jgi:hypothetical protein
MMDRPSRSPLLAALAATAGLLVLAPAGCGPARPKLEKFHTSGRVDPGAFPDVPAVVLLDRTELRFTFSAAAGRPYAEQIRTRRIQLLKPESLELARVMIPFDDRSTIFHVQARRTSEMGEVEEMPPDRALDMMRFKDGSPPAKLYGGKGFKLTKVSRAQVGDVIELSWVRVFTDPRWVDPIRVSGELPVVRGEVVVDYPRQFDVDYRVTKLGEVIATRPTKIPVRVKSVEEGGEGIPGTRLAWVFENEKAIYPEDLRPSTDALSTQVHVQLKGYTLSGKRYSAYTSWDDVARWYRELIGDNDQPGGAVSGVTSKLGGKQGRKRDKLRRVQRYLQDEVGDIPTFLNLSALPARSASDIVQVGWGDAKDQASLGLALLRDMGVDGFPVLVSRLGSFAAVPDLPTPAPFNHVVIAMPAGGRFQFIDPSTPGLPTGRLPGSLQGQVGLLIRPDRAELIDLPEDPPRANKVQLAYNLALGVDGTVSGQIVAKLDGLDAAKVRAELAAGGEGMVERIKEHLVPGDKSKLVWVNALAVNQKGADNPDATLQLQIVLGASRLGTLKPSGAIDLPMEQIVGRPLPSLWREVRYMPLVWGYKRQRDERVTLDLPPKMGVDLLPLGHDQKSELVSISDRYAVADGKLYLKRELELNTRKVEPEDYNQVKRPVRAIWETTASPIRIKEGGDRGSSYGTDPF